MVEHSNRNHAVLAASSSKRWLNCPPSVRLEENFPNAPSSYAQEGTFMHELCEYKIRHNYLHEEVEKPVSTEFQSDEIEQTTDTYYEFVVSLIEEIKKNCEPLILIEEKLNYSHIAPGGFGTGDLVLIGKNSSSQGVIHVVDFKGGRGVFVDANHNSQMMLYALGALVAYDFIWDINIIKMSIVQPRMNNISTFECSRTELENWGNSIKSIAQLAYKGEGEQKTGDWCKFCRAKSLCKACSNEALALCKKDFLGLTQETEPPIFKKTGLLSLEKLSEILPILNRIRSWIDDVFSYVSAEAIDNGVHIKGYKVVRGKSNRVFTDIDTVIKIAQENGYSEIFKQQVITLTEFEKLMGKEKFNNLLGQFVTKPLGKLTLVPEDDPRPAITIDKIKDDFKSL